MALETQWRSSHN